MAKRKMAPQTPNSVPPLKIPKDFRRLLTGLGSSVAVVDAGFNPSVRGRGGQFFDFTNPRGTALDETSTQHGTTVMATIHRYSPGAVLHGAKVGGSDNALNSILTMRPLEWCRNQNVDVVNLSLGFPMTGCLHGNCLLCDLVNALVDGGVVVVVAAGNLASGVKGGRTIRCPGIAERALTVGALDESGARFAPYSVDTVPGRAKPDVLAPGTVISGDGTRHEGTSFAAPLVTAMVANLCPCIGFQQAADLVRQTADKRLIPSRMQAC